MISPRFAPALCILVALALVPTVLHRYVGAIATDGRVVTAIPTSLAGASSVPSARDAGWGERRFKSADWFERQYQVDRHSVVLTVLRSYDLKRLYHHPELDVAYGVPFISHRVAILDGGAPIAVHVLDTGPAARGMAVYALHYEGQFVEDPLRFQIRLARELLIGARKPMTLFFSFDAGSAFDAGSSGDAALDRLPAARILRAAVHEFTTQREPPSR